jgi:phosphosulfolactate phosphohydrolase-like enzyme
MKTTDTTAAKNREISRRILLHVAAGMDIRQAVDAVLGAGTVAKIIDEVYEALRAGA